MEFFKNSFIKVQFTYHTIHPLKLFNSVLFNIFTKLYSNQRNLISEQSYLPLKEMPTSGQPPFSP